MDESGIYVSADSVGEDGFFHPTSPEDFEAMLALFDDVPEGAPHPGLSEEAALEAAKALGFDTGEDE